MCVIVGDVPNSGYMLLFGGWTSISTSKRETHKKSVIMCVIVSDVPDSGLYVALHARTCMPTCQY